MGQMKKYNQLLTEMPAKTVVFAFGRFQPPTTGHELLVKAVARLAQQRRASHVIFASRTQDKKKNPLTVERKVHYLKMMFPRINFAAANDDVRTFIEAAKFLNKKYKNIIMVAGSDRVPEYTRLLNTYNGKDFKFDTIEVISAGQRDPDADNATGMSGTKMRQHAEKGNYAEFKKGLPSTLRDIDGRRLMNDIRMGLGMEAIREQVIFKKDELREQYFRGEIFNVGDCVEDKDSVYKIVNRGSNHLLVQETSGELVSKWIQDVKPTEREFMLDESLSNKTLKTSDKIKVGRVIATMLGVENAESMSNPTQMVNLGLRNIRKKALNAAALELINKMIELAKSMDIKYDDSLLPQKLKENEVVNPKSKRNIAKDVLRFSDYKKLSKMNEEDDAVKDTESDFDAEKSGFPHEVGKNLVAGNDDQLRRRKVNYKLSEAEDPAAKAAQKEQAKAALAAKQAKEKEALALKQAREREGLKNEETKLSSFREIVDLEENTAVRNKANKSGVSYGTLIKVYRRGVAAWNSGHRPGTTPEQWGLARVNSYINKGKGTYHGADKDLREEQIDEKMKSVPKDKDTGLAKKYVAGLSKSTAAARKAHWDKADKLSDRDPEAYKPAPGDATAKTKPSKHTIAFKKKFGEEVAESTDAYGKSLQAIADKKKNDSIKPKDKETLAKLHALMQKANEECAYDTMTQGVAPMDFDDVTSSINPPHEEKFEDHFPVDSEGEKEIANWEKEISILDVMQDDQVDAMVAAISDEELIDLAYDDDELEEIDDETGEPYEMDDEEKELDESLRLVEGLSRMERIKARQRLKRTQAKRKRSINISMKRMSSSKVANLRARRAAIKKIKQRVLRGRNPSQLSVSEKERVEKFVASKKGLINRLAMKMVPRVRQLEKKRMKNARMK